MTTRTFVPQVRPFFTPRLKDVVTVDFETYYEDNKGYSLGNPEFNTSQYIRDPRFLAHGVGIKIGTGKTYWYTGEDIYLALQEIDWSNKALLAHNTPFDGMIVTHHYDILPAVYLDTLAMARGLHPQNMSAGLDYLARFYGLQGKEKKQALTDLKGVREPDEEQLKRLGGYCVDDVEATFELFRVFREHMPAEELHLIHITTRMFCEPVFRCNHKLLYREIDLEVRKKRNAVRRIPYTSEVLMSNDKFAGALREQGAEPPVKISPHTGEYTYAFAKTDPGFKALRKHDNETVRDLVNARIYVKSTIRETRARRMLTATENGWRLPILLHYCKPHTMRWSGGDKLNPQNFNRADPKDPASGLLRRSIEAPHKYRILVVDLKQIEARMLAWLAGHQTLLKAFVAGEDVYKIMAATLYGGRPQDYGKDSMERFIGKTCVLGLGYGMGHAKLRTTLAEGSMGPEVHMELHETRDIVLRYRNTNPQIPQYWVLMETLMACMFLGHEEQFGPMEVGKRFIRMPNGLFLQYPGLTGTPYQDRHGTLRLGDASYNSGKGRTNLYGGKQTENVVQCLSRITISDHMRKADEAGIWTATTTHDELVAVAPASRAQRDFEQLSSIMSTPPSWCKGLPLGTEGGWAFNYSK